MSDADAPAEPRPTEADEDWRRPDFWNPVEAPIGLEGSRGTSWSWLRRLFGRVAAFPANAPIVVSAAAVATLEAAGDTHPRLDDHELAATARQLRGAAELARSARNRRRREGWVSDNVADWCSFAVLVGLALLIRGRWNQPWSFALWAWVAMVVYASVVGLFSGFLRWHPVARDLFAPLTRRLERRWSASWSGTARTYFTVGIALILVLAAAATILSVAFPGTIFGLLLAAVLGGLADAIALLLVVLVDVAGRALRLPDDPYPELITGLLEALTSLDRASTMREGVQILDVESRRMVAGALDRCARVIASDAALYPAVSADISHAARAGALVRGRRVAAWLHQCESDILWPSPAAARELTARLQAGLLAVCAGDWDKLESDVPEPTRVGTWRRILPRVALALALVGAALLLPIAFDGSLSSTAQDTMRVSLIIAAVTALVTPSQALSDASSAVSGMGGSSR